MLGQQAVLCLSSLLSTTSSSSHYLSLPKEAEEQQYQRTEASSTPRSQQDWCRIRPNEHGQQQCRGCNEICSLMRWGEVQRRQDAAFEGRSEARLFHSNYRELDMCATRYGCDTCRTMRRAFLLAQITGSGAQSLECPDQQWPVYAVLDICHSGDSLLLSIEAPHTTLFSAAVPLRHEKPLVTNDPTRKGGRLRADFTELRHVIRECHENHDCSWKYRWSDQNPSWLLEILPNNEAQLVKGPDQPVEYVVLSYSWGDPEAMPTAEWARIKAAATQSKNRDGQPVVERLRPFSRWDLPEIMQDAIAIAEGIGFRYIWIDSVCIPKGTNWDTEASVMHEVYGNAVFTLAASSCTKATENLLHDRLAWKHRSKACKLRGMWLLDNQPSLDEVRLGSPVSQRGWTLQEERLSPRILYWASQRWYWSCPERQVAELSQMGCPSPRPKQGAWSPPQNFLEVCRTGEEQQLDKEWLDVVEAYTRRDLAHAKDRFLAISGLAVRLYNAKVENVENNATEEYLAGLWRDNIAENLAWSVDRAANPQNNLLEVAPSWSWASLPLKMETTTKHNFRPSEHFRLISSSRIETTPSKFTNRGQIIEERGRTVKTLEVQGRFRRFISDESQEVHWDSIEKKHGCRTGYNFSMLPGRPLHARNSTDGRLVTKEAHRGEIVAQLDYFSTQNEEGEKEGPHVYLPDGAERELVCLELGDLAMLLLQQVPNKLDTFRRVGVCIDYANRKGFFYGCDVRRIHLC
ncbi:heterokaryon incompatibility protein-domain-containing protein [Immersiella caudata]|uniref:Heterokaryon incompatibility protein-domain-containing protein n=1 Tax=Immersiella caudata TaxID=314043 RepID=A0AA39X286_9PEZI|nr:heterokaryon incompatibility protein-domain-containing protein [Immersiella caudata]